MDLLNLLEFAPLFFKIRTKPGDIIDFKFNRAQLFIHDRLQSQLEKTGKVRALILKGRQQGCCYAPSMRVMASDYRWIKIDDVQIGDSLMAVDEYPGEHENRSNNERKIRSCIVEAKIYQKSPAYEVALNNGTILTVTGEHRHLCKGPSGTAVGWKAVKFCKPGDSIRAFSCDSDDHDPDFEDGWIGGLLDGEGSFGAYPAARIALSQVDGPVLRRYKDYLNKRNIKYYELIDTRTNAGGYSKLGDKPVHCIRIDRMADILKVICHTRPTRFVDRPIFEGKRLPKSGNGFDAWPTIISIKPVGNMTVVDLQTSTKTYICEGLVSHNSTYIQARFCHRVITSRGKKAFILTHEIEATQNLFEITKRYIENLPPGLAPIPDKSSHNKLHFNSLDSGYTVGTAGNKSTGRSQTVQLLHCSEVGFYPHADDTAKGVMQAVSNSDNTEIVLESTANGIGNYFHQRWQEACKGESEYQAIFVPWYWQDEYKVQPIKEYYLSDTERELISTYGDDGLTEEHLLWRRQKMSEFSGDDTQRSDQFSQEYPFNAIEAFINPESNPFINGACVSRARKGNVDSDAALVIGVDPAISDKDRFVIIRRRGRLVYGIEVHYNHDTMQIAGRIRKIIDSEKPAKVFIDSIGIGAGVVDRLREQGLACVEGIAVSRSASDPDKFKNLRAELWYEMREWLLQDADVQIPDDDNLHGELTGLGFKYDSSGRLQIESKDDLKKRGMKSPDLADALALTFSGGSYVNASVYKPTFMPKSAYGKFT